jgi:hypothetical protein
MAEIRTTVDGSGRAYLDLGSTGEVRDSVELGDHEASSQVPALDSLVLHFDFYGRLAAIEVTDSVNSVLPPALIDAADAD